MVKFIDINDYQLIYIAIIISFCIGIIILFACVFFKIDGHFEEKRKRKVLEEPANKLLCSLSLENVAELLYLTKDEKTDLFEGKITLLDLECSGYNAIRKGYYKNGITILKMLEYVCGIKLYNGKEYVKRIRK